MLVMDNIYNGDCLPLMCNFPNKYFDLVITDPPYGIKRDAGFGGATGFGGVGKPIERRIYIGENWDNIRPGKEYFDEMIRISKNQIIFGGNFFTDLLPQSNHWIVWDKQNTMPTFGDCELIWTSFYNRNSVKLFTYTWNGLIGKEKDRFHPTQKPIILLKWLIENYSKPYESIFDPFLGSGTTTAASVETNRHFIGIEKDKEYFEISKMRTSKAKVFPQEIKDMFGEF